MKKILFLIGLILLLGGCEMNGAKRQNLTVPAGTTWEGLIMPENSEKVNDEFSGSKWTGTVGEEKYQIRFDPENNICKIYWWEDIFNPDFDPNWKEWFFTQDSCFRKNEEGKILFDFKPYIDYAESYSMEKCWLEMYALTKKFYEDKKKVFENTKNPKTKEIAKEQMDQHKKSLEQLAAFTTLEEFEEFVKKNVDPKSHENGFQIDKKSHSSTASALKAINPVTAILSADKKTLTLKKMFIGLKKDDTPKYAENVVFTRE